MTFVAVPMQTKSRGTAIVSALQQRLNRPTAEKPRPVFTINRRVARAFLDESAGLESLVARMAQCLNAYPHFFILRGPPPTEDAVLTVQIAKAIAGLKPHPLARVSGQALRVSHTRVEIDRNATLATGVTRYSRTHLALTPHTDSSYNPVPHELLAFQMVRDDAEGGVSILAPIEDVLANLDDAQIVALHKTKVPFGKRSYPVLWRQQGQSHIRFYDQQIQAAVSNGAALSEAARGALQPLQDVINVPRLFHSFALRGGETLFLHNTLALHGRTGFAKDSNRLMLRIRIYAGALV